MIKNISNYISLPLVIAGFFMMTSSSVFAQNKLIQKLWDSFSAPTGIAEDSEGAIYVTNWSGGTVEKIEMTGKRTVMTEGIRSPAGIAVDSDGAVYIASYSGDSIIRITQDGEKTIIADGLSTPTGITLTGRNSLLVTNRSSGDVLEIDLATGNRTIRASHLSLPVGVVEMPDKSLVISQYGGRVTRVMHDGRKQEFGKDFLRPGVGIIPDGEEAVIVVDNGDSTIKRVSFDAQEPPVLTDTADGIVALMQRRNGQILFACWSNGSVYSLQKEDITARNKDY